MIFNSKHQKVLYAHYKKSNNEIFYIGYGDFDRPHSKSGRNQHWHNVVKKHDYLVEILETNLSLEQAKEKKSN